MSTYDPSEFDHLVDVLVAERDERRRLEAAEPEPEPPEPEPDERGGFGYYQQGTDVEAIYRPQEERWGRELDHVLCFLPMDQGWSGIAVPTWWADSFGADRNPWAADYGTVVSLPLCPDDYASIDEVDPDELWQAFREAGEHLVAAGLGKCYARIGWEPQGTWYPWSAVGHPGTYKARFRDAAAALREAEGQAFRIEWNIAGGKEVDLAAFPDEGVDVVSIDLYDNQSLDAQLGWLDEARELAADKGALFAITEWGVWGSDAPDYMRQMTAYISEHRPAHQAYFDVDSSADHRLSQYPESAEVYGAWAPSAP